MIVVKRLVERALVAGGFAAAGRARRRRDILILGYHNVLPHGESAHGDTSLHLPHREFSRQLDAIERHHEVVRLSSILGESAPARRPRVVITFDDAYLGALTVAVPELAGRGMAATIFVAPALLGATTWWDALSDEERGAVPLAIRERALIEFAGDGEAIRRWAGPFAGRFVARGASRIGTEAELAEAARHPGITVASHSWSHPNLRALAGDVLEYELNASRDWLRDRFTSFTPWLSYPYGLYSPAVERAAAACGYVGALRVDGGWALSSAPRSTHALPRYNVPSGLSLDGFRLRLGGLRAG